MKSLFQAYGFVLTVTALAASRADKELVVMIQTDQVEDKHLQVAHADELPSASIHTLGRSIE